MIKLFNIINTDILLILINKRFCKHVHTKNKKSEKTHTYTHTHTHTHGKKFCVKFNIFHMSQFIHSNFNVNLIKGKYVSKQHK